MRARFPQYQHGCHVARFNRTRPGSRASLKVVAPSERPQGDLNPRRRRERAVSWTGLDDGDGCRQHELTWDRTRDPHIKSVLLYQLSYEPFPWRWQAALYQQGVRLSTGSASTAVLVVLNSFGEKGGAVVYYNS